MGILQPLALSSYWPHPSVALVLLYLLLVVVAFLTLSGKARLVLLGLPFLLLGLSALPADNDGDLTITMLDVGQGDSLHIRYPDGTSALVDTGGLRSRQGGESFIGERIVGRYLWEERISKLRFVLISHPHEDHVRGFTFLKAAFRIDKLHYYDPHPSYPSEISQKLCAGATFEVGEVHHRVLYPPCARPEALSQNEASLVVLLRYREFTMLFTGDIERKPEIELIPTVRPVTILKIPHHGGRTSSSEAFLDAASPEGALVSAGRSNSFGHPSPEVLARYRYLGIPVFTTPEQGSLRIVTDGRSWRVQGYSASKGGFELLGKGKGG